ncbi:MAG: hypothetical protein AB7V56_06370 [Candidatus Nitrosocosmicus sp.]
MIPIANTGFARPVFDGTTFGQQCGALWDEINGLKIKKANQGGKLSEEDERKLKVAESNYNDVCKKIYGEAPITNDSFKTPGIATGNFEDIQPAQNQQLTPKSIPNDTEVSILQSDQMEQPELSFSEDSEDSSSENDTGDDPE